MTVRVPRFVCFMCHLSMHSLPLLVTMSTVVSVREVLEYIRIATTH
jgi:hypothetical protein